MTKIVNCSGVVFRLRETSAEWESTDHGDDEQDSGDDGNISGSSNLTRKSLDHSSDTINLRRSVTNVLLEIKSSNFTVSRAVKLSLKSDKEVHATFLEESFSVTVSGHRSLLSCKALHEVVHTFSVFAAPFQGVSVEVHDHICVLPQNFVGVVWAWVALAIVLAHVGVDSFVEVVLNLVLDSLADNVDSSIDKSSSSHHDESENQTDESNETCKDDEEGGEPALLAFAC